MTNWTDNNRVFAELHMRELRAAAQQARLARQVRGPRPLRNRVGRLLVAAGERLVA
ncbi:MAG TPA: hypothetical protein VFE42_18775 [Chloroflexota bacterium]|nr:hypothetical protein [Chloroflexota bacterium]